MKKKSVEIPKGHSEAVNRRLTDNTMVQRKMTRGQTDIQTLPRKLMMEQHKQPYSVVIHVSYVFSGCIIVIINRRYNITRCDKKK